MQVHEIQLLGRSFKIRSEQDPEYLSEVAEYIDGKLEGITKGKQGMAAQNALLLTVLNVADELFQSRAEHNSLKESIRVQSQNLLSRMGTTV